MSKKNLGSSIDDFLKQEGIFEDAQAQAVKEVVAWQLAAEMKEKKISKNKMAQLLKTSRTRDHFQLAVRLGYPVLDFRVPCFLRPCTFPISVAGGQDGG